MAAGENIDNSVNTHAPSVVMVESSKHLTAMIVICSISAALSSYALSVAFQARDSAWQSETQYLIANDKVERLSRELAAHGIEPPNFPPMTRVK